MNIVLFNTAIATSNLGDYIICDSAKEELKSLLDTSFVMELGSHVKNFGVAYYCYPNTKIDFLKRADYKFVLGTNLLTSNMLRSIRQWPMGLIERKAYKDCIMMGVGTTYDSIKMDVLTRQMYKQILRKDIAHSVRDEKSKQLIESLGNYHVIDTGCPTLWGLTEDVCQSIPKEKAKNVVFTVSGYKNQKDIEKDQCMLEILENNYDNLYLWVQTTEDNAYYETLKHNKPVKKLFTLEQFRNVCINGDVDYIGTRLHGGIFAMQNRVRSIIIEIDHRAAGFREINRIITLKRDHINELEDLIHQNIKTEIKIRSKEINEWLGQFK